MTDTATLLFLIVAIILVIITLIFSAMAVRDSRKSASECQDGCYKYSLWSAIISGLTAGMLIIAMIMTFVSGRKGGRITGMTPSVFTSL